MEGVIVWSGAHALKDLFLNGNCSRRPYPDLPPLRYEILRPLRGSTLRSDDPLKGMGRTESRYMGGKTPPIYLDSRTCATAKCCVATEG